ncbi:nucleotidyl transferase AbiEii/AbiGii toxin family protein [Candidatus Amesbacteria bacterium]|nr:nucleotidyl transferase AbiEii/AbiGii toxin family protein [Candidatus Amesbacteria bacterium]MBI2587460.1 nucleotidyl transferase AbiEii/AbiGii toxin family protein [Candidatus Amesbacteria bacterium]
MKYNLTNNPILKDFQIQILELFFKSDFSRPFFLTGGTALSAFYFAHRESKDLDLFTLQAFDPLRLTQLISEIAKKTGSTPNIKVASNTYQEIYLTSENSRWTQRIDLVHDVPRHFGELSRVGDIIVDSLENIGSNKVLTVFGRLEPKDYIDLYVILKDSYLKFDDLFELAKQKDLGLDKFHLAHSINQIANIEVWPENKLGIKNTKIINFYRNLVKKLLRDIKPE